MELDDEEDEALAATIDTESKFSKSTSSSSDSVSESPYEAKVNSSVLYLKVAIKSLDDWYLDNIWA